MYFRGNNVRIQADYVFSKEYGDLFTVRDLANETGKPLVFTRHAERVLEGVRAGSTVYFKFYGDPKQDSFTLEIRNEDDDVVDLVDSSDLRLTWQMALLLMLSDIARDTNEAIAE